MSKNYEDMTDDERQVYQGNVAAGTVLTNGTVDSFYKVIREVAEHAYQEGLRDGRQFKVNRKGSDVEDSTTTDP